MFERIVNFFMPATMRGNIAHRNYHEFRVVVSACLIGLPLVLLFPIPLYYLGKPYMGYLANGLMISITLLCSRYLGHYRIPMSIMALVTYFIIYGWIKGSGQIFSSNVSILHMYLLCAIWADKRYGWWAIFTNLILFYVIYHNTQLPGHTRADALYALIMNCLITIFFGGFLAYLQLDQERDRLKIKALQEKRISMLDDAVKMRTEQLNTMRETLASDFHDETGNMLSAITRQATLLKLKLIQQNDVQLIVESIIKNSKRLYASSKDFIWQLNHNSDDPAELFDYLTGYGQSYYNQFDIAFSSHTEPCNGLQLDPSAALNLIFIFKEAMTNIIEHSGATEVRLGLNCQLKTVRFNLRDNGTWKRISTDREHYGLSNIEKRCKRNGFKLHIATDEEGTTISITAPVSSALPV